MRLLITTFVIIAAIWISPLFLPEESGLVFGLPYRVFYTLVTLFCALFFYLLRTPSIGPFKSARRAVATVVLVFLSAIGAVALLANVSPQFAFEGAATAGGSAEERGQAVYNNPNVGCFLCHSAKGVGGTRGPDLTHAGTAAGRRKPGMSAEDYLKESLVNPGAYVVSPFDNIMPSFDKRLSPEEFNDLIAYLTSLK